MTRSGTRRLSRSTIRSGSVLAANPASVVTAIAVSFVVATAASAVELAKVFPREADVIASQAGLVRLDLPAGVLEQCRPDLSDLRVFDAAGKEVPFFVARVRPDAGLELTRRAAGRVVGVKREEVRRTTGPPLRRETYEVEFPAAGKPRGVTSLDFQVARDRFVAKVTVTELHPGATETALVSGSIFRVGGVRPATRLALALPESAGDALLVTLESEEDDYLTPAFERGSSRLLDPAERISVPLRIVATSSGDGRTILELARPGGVVPDLLKLRAETKTFHRKVTVRDGGPESDGPILGVATLYRLEGFVPIEALEAAVAAARGTRLTVEIEDGDSPPLTSPMFDAEIRRPSLVFSLPSAATGAILRFGGGRAHLPAYDLAGLRLPHGGSAEGKRAEALALVHDLASLPRATLGETRANPDYDRAPALAFAMRPGAALDASSFRSRRALWIGAAPEGLSRIALAPSDMAILREDLGDLRIVDGNGRQWPYLVEREGVLERVDLELDPPEHEGRSSVYRIRPPAAPLPIERILLETDAAFIDRAFTLAAATAGGPDAGETETVLASGRLLRPAHSDPRPLAIVIPNATRVRWLTLTVEDGDESPLAFRAARGRVPIPHVYVAAPEGEYALLLGDAEQLPPRYDFERVRGVVLSVSHIDARLGTLTENPSHGLAARLRGRSLQTTALWAALVVAVASLLWVTLRLARKRA